MELLAKPVLDNKFWIVEKDGHKVGTIRNNDTGVTLNWSGNSKSFKHIDDLQKHVRVTFIEKQVAVVEKQEYQVHDYPCKTEPFNAIYDLKRKLPLYTKTENSQSFFCAGYYVVHWEDGSHSPSYCPKLITLSRYDYEGPFKTKLEMTEVLRKST